MCPDCKTKVIEVHFLNKLSIRGHFLCLLCHYARIIENQYIVHGPWGLFSWAMTIHSKNLTKCVILKQYFKVCLFMHRIVSKCSPNWTYLGHFIIGKCIVHELGGWTIGKCIVHELGWTGQFNFIG